MRPGPPSRRPVGRFLAALLPAVIVGIGVLPADPEFEVDVILSKSKSLFASRDFPEALEEFRRALQQHDDVRTRQAALVEIGRCQQKLGRLDEAIASFSEAAALGCAGCGPGESPSSYLLQAQDSLARALLEKKDYAAALDAFLSLSRLPRSYFCGLGPLQDAYRDNVYQGICLEGLGRHAEAVAAYFRAAANEFKPAAAHVRIARLYRASGQVRDLKEILKANDARCAVEMGAFRRKSGTPAEPEDVECRSSGAIRGILRLHDLGERGDLKSLVDLVAGVEPDASTTYVPPENLIEASVALAARPRRSVPLLKERLESATERKAFILHALGLCGTQEAVDTLKGYAIQETNYWRLLDIVHALAVAGPRGGIALTSLSAAATDNLAGLLAQHREGRVEEIWQTTKNLEGLPFPPIPPRLRLPSRLEPAREQDRPGHAPRTQGKAGGPGAPGPPLRRDQQAVRLQTFPLAEQL